MAERRRAAPAPSGIGGAPPRAKARAAPAAGRGRGRGRAAVNADDGGIPSIPEFVDQEDQLALEDANFQYGGDADAAEDQALALLSNEGAGFWNQATGHGEISLTEAQIEDIAEQRLQRGKGKGKGKKGGKGKGSGKGLSVPYMDATNRAACGADPAQTDSMLQCAVSAHRIVVSLKVAEPLLLSSSFQRHSVVVSARRNGAHTNYAWSMANQNLFQSATNALLAKKTGKPMVKPQYGPSGQRRLQPTPLRWSPTKGPHKNSSAVPQRTMPYDPRRAIA